MIARDVLHGKACSDGLEKLTLFSGHENLGFHAHELRCDYEGQDLTLNRESLLLTEREPAAKPPMRTPMGPSIWKMPLRNSTALSSCRRKLGGIISMATDVSKGAQHTIFC